MDASLSVAPTPPARPAATLAATPATPTGAAPLLEATREIAAGPLHALAEAIDRQGVYPRQVLHDLGAAGALRPHLEAPVGSGDYGLAIQAMAEVSRVCGATGFMVWCQQVCGLYLQASGNPALQGDLLDRHAAGQTLGGTGMSNPMKRFSGIESLLLRARRVAGGYRVSGTLPWVSNLGPRHYFGAVAGVEDGAPHEFMFLVRCDGEGVSLRECPSFSGMEGTGTYAVRLQDHFVSDEAIIADPVQPFVRRIRGAFILLQMGMGLGVAQGAIDSMWEVEPQLGHVNQYLEDRPDALQAELDELGERIFALARTPFETDTDFVVDVLDLRAQAAEFGLRATQSALLHQGARGYLLSSAVQRRVREAHFVAIVTPAIKHLRKEIARLQTEEMPG